MMSQLFFQNTFILRRSRVANFAGIIKIATMLKQPVKTQKEFKKLEIRKVQMSAKLKVSEGQSIIIVSLLHVFTGFSFIFTCEYKLALRNFTLNTS